MQQIKAILPKSVRTILRGIAHKLKEHWHFYQQRRIIDYTIKRHQTALKTLSKKDKINCVFLALFESVWKYDSIYNLLEKDSRFNLCILVCPIVNEGEESLLNNMNLCYKALKGKGYNVIKAYNNETKEYVDIRNDLHADLLFYTNPYKGLIDNRYYITEYPDILSIYVPYHFSNNNDYSVFNNLLFHNLLWRNYVETEDSKDIYRKHQLLKGRNVVATGYPGIEPFLNELQAESSKHITRPASSVLEPLLRQEKGTGYWKNKGNKRIIWAPHHTIRPVGNVNFSCFIQYASFMLQMAKKYEENIDITFKPHPLLKNKLIKEWGKEKTDAYYHQWETMPNTSVNEGEYIDLFLESDAMIHDSGSFLIEYLYTKKPVMRTMNDIDPKTMYNDFALDALDVYYKGYNEQDIEQFIQDVIDGVDPMKEARDKFYQERLLPPNGKLPSENIVNDIIDSIENQRL